MTTNIERMIKTARAGKRKRGQREWLKHLHGERITRQEAINAKYDDCVNGEDTNPCIVDTCALIDFCLYVGQADSVHPKKNTNWD